MKKFLKQNTPKAQSIKEKFGNLGFIKIKNFCLLKNTSDSKTSHRVGGNICKTYMC